jgi:hypothetical protein
MNSMAPGSKCCAWAAASAATTISRPMRTIWLSSSTKAPPARKIARASAKRMRRPRFSSTRSAVSCITVISSSETLIAGQRRDATGHSPHAAARVRGRGGGGARRSQPHPCTGRIIGGKRDHLGHPLAAHDMHRQGGARFSQIGTHLRQRIALLHPVPIAA